MKRTACLLALAASAGGFALAQTAPRPAPVLVDNLPEGVHLV